MDYWRFRTMMAHWTKSESCSADSRLWWLAMYDFTYLSSLAWLIPLFIFYLVSIDHLCNGSTFKTQQEFGPRVLTNANSCSLLDCNGWSTVARILPVDIWYSRAIVRLVFVCIYSVRIQLLGLSFLSLLILFWR